jgi:hypothetical protein
MGSGELGGLKKEMPKQRTRLSIMREVVVAFQRINRLLDGGGDKLPTIEHWKRCIPGSPEVLQAIAARLEAQGCTFRFQDRGIDGKAYLWLGCVPKSERPVCGARTRKGKECQARCTVNGSRCRLHGGLSSGPKTEAGRDAIRESNRRRGQAQRATQAHNNDSFAT